MPLWPLLDGVERHRQSIVLHLGHDADIDEHSRPQRIGPAPAESRPTACDEQLIPVASPSPPRVAIPPARIVPVPISVTWIGVAVSVSVIGIVPVTTPVTTIV